MINMGIIGYGLMGVRHADLLQERCFAGTATVVAVFDSNPDRVIAAEKQLGVRGYGSLEEFLRHNGLDAVYIATPDDAHLLPFLACVDAGVAILVEKPLATTVEHARKMLEVADHARRPVEVSWGNRWSLPFVALKRAIKQGELGEVRCVKSWLSNPKQVPLEMYSWASRSTCGWYLLSHVLDLTTWLTGSQPLSVFARGTKRTLVELGVNTYDYLSALVDYEGGMAGIYESCWILPEGLGKPFDFQFHAIGSKGSSSIDLGHQMIEVSSDQMTRWPRDITYWHDQTMAFLMECEQGTVSMDSVRSGFVNTATLTALHKSAESGVVERVEAP
jgi:predicted dehydrogenase